jgi:hypothetical protein
MNFENVMHLHDQALMLEKLPPEAAVFPNRYFQIVEGPTGSGPD